jgi:hypothetical protein
LFENLSVTVVLDDQLLVAKVKANVKILRSTVIIGLVVDKFGILVVAFGVLLVDKMDTTVVDACLVVASTLKRFDSLTSESEKTQKYGAFLAHPVNIPATGKCLHSIQTAQPTWAFYNISDLDHKLLESDDLEYY